MLNIHGNIAADFLLWSVNLIFHCRFVLSNLFFVITAVNSLFLTDVQANLCKFLMEDSLIGR